MSGADAGPEPMPAPQAEPAAPTEPEPRPMQPAPAEIEILPLAEMERRMIEAALARTGNDVPLAAAMLQINPSTIYRRLQAWRAAG